jgi:hypothetical protein
VSRQDTIYRRLTQGSEARSQETIGGTVVKVVVYSGSRKIMSYHRNKALNHQRVREERRENWPLGDEAEAKGRDRSKGRN